jgi:hypothetical protein
MKRVQHSLNPALGSGAQLEYRTCTVGSAPLACPVKIAVTVKYQTTPTRSPCTQAEQKL